MRARTQTMLVVVLLCAARLVKAQDEKYPIKKYDLGNATYKSEKVRCPRTIEATHLNVLRYGYAWNSEVTFDKAPDLWGGLVGVAAPADTKTAAKPAAKPAVVPSDKTPQQIEEQERSACKGDPKNPFGSGDSLFCSARGLAARIERESELGARRITDQVAEQRSGIQVLINRTINPAFRAVKDAGADLQNLLKDSSGDPEKVKQALAERLTPHSLFLLGVEATWPHDDVSTKRAAAGTLVAEIAVITVAARRNFAQNSADVSSLEGRLRSESSSLEQQLAKIETGVQRDNKKNATASQTLKDKIAADDNALALLSAAKTAMASDLDDLDYATKEADKTLTVLDDVSDTSTKYAQFRDARNELARWKGRMAALAAGLNENIEAAFSSRHSADGEFAFSQTKKTALTLTRTDLMPGAKDAKAETVLDVTVECTLPFTISAGVAFSSLSQREFAIVPSKDPNNPNNVINKFESTATSSFHPLPLGMIHARVWEGGGRWQNLGLHASFGMAGNFRSQNSGGSDVEFLVGPSVSLFRAMFLTPGLHIGHKVSLGGGFNEGDIVPASITQPPLQKSYKLGFGLAITFAKP